MKHGKGRVRMTNYSYTGEFQHDLKHGQGVLEWDDGRRYEGGFEQGQFHGTAVRRLSVFEVFRRALEALAHSRPHVQVMIWPDGRRYVGHYLEEPLKALLDPTGAWLAGPEAWPGHLLLAGWPPLRGPVGGRPAPRRGHLHQRQGLHSTRHLATRPTNSMGGALPYKVYGQLIHLYLSLIPCNSSVYHTIRAHNNAHAPCLVDPYLAGIDFWCFRMVLLKVQGFTHRTFSYSDLIQCTSSCLPPLV